MRFPHLGAGISPIGLAIVAALGHVGSVWGQDTKPSDTQSALPAVQKDIAYAAGGDERKLDLFLPNNKDFTTFVFTFGGGWHTGSRKAVAPIGQKLQSLGFGCALLSHRLGPKHKFPAQIEDVAAGFAWVKKHIAERGGDPGRVFLMGHSSGAHLSLLLAADPTYLAKHKLSLADIAGVIGLSAPVDLERLLPSSILCLSILQKPYFAVPSHQRQLPATPVCTHELCNGIGAPLLC